ncbi:MAG: HAD family hydrolase [Bulleidia sp.]
MESKIGVVFDFNGTLFFDTPFHVQAWSAVGEEIGYGPVTRRQMETCFSGLPNVEILRQMCPGEEQAWYTAYAQRKEEFYRKAIRAQGAKAALAPGAEDFLRWLNRRPIPFTIASASIRENILFFVDLFRLDRWLDPALIVYDDGSYTDKTAMYSEASRRIRRPDLIVFEDALAGIRAASKRPNTRLIVIRSALLQEQYASYPCIMAVIQDYKNDRRRLETILEAEL